MKKVYLTFFLLQLCCTAMLHAQQWTVYNTINSGIPSNNIRAIAIDNDGDAWIGCTSGIAELNGTVWTTYGSYAGGYQLDALAFDSNNELWIAPDQGLVGGTLCHFNDSCFTQWDSISQPFHIFRSSSIAIDSSDNIWLGGGPTVIGKILKYDGSTWTLYDNTSIGTANSIEVDGAQNIWVASGGRVCKFDGNVWTQYTVQNSVNDLAIDGNDTKWLATNSGLVRFDSVMTTYNTSNSNIQSDKVLAVTIDLMGNKWIGTDYGVAMFDDTNWTFYTTSNSDLPSNDIRTIEAGPDGRIWVGTMNEGLAVFQDSTLTPSCSASFEMVPNPFVPSDWYAVQTATGNGQLQYFWEWGDGSTTSNVAFPSHTYTTPGYYNICLTVTDADSCSVTYCDSSTYIYKAMEMVTVNVVNELPFNVGVNEHATVLPHSFYPNPTNGGITIDLRAVSGPLTINTFNTLGELVGSENRQGGALVNHNMPEATGIYVVQLVHPDFNTAHLRVVRE